MAAACASTTCWASSASGGCRMAPIRAHGAYVEPAHGRAAGGAGHRGERAGAVIIGEDLGTVAPGVRRRLAAANVLSTRLAYFERRPPARWPRKAMAGITTHDLPTVAGTWTGADLPDQARAGVRARSAGAGAAPPAAGQPGRRATRRLAGQRDGARPCGDRRIAVRAGGGDPGGRAPRPASPQPTRHRARRTGQLVARAARHPGGDRTKADCASPGARHWRGRDRA